MVNADVRNKEGIQTYTSHWEADAANDDDNKQKQRLGVYTYLVNSYYDGATALYEYGWGTSFHFCRFYPGEPFYQALARHEHYLASRMGLKKDMKVLDVGCGVGGPAREIARFSDAKITGLNNNMYQIEKATKYTAKAGLSNQVNYVKGDFMKLGEQFGPNSFDAVYAIEATCHAPTFEGVYGEIYKVLKPGGVAGIYEWVMSDSWDPSNPEHKKISHGIELGNGIAEMRSLSAARAALKSVGFIIEHDEDLAERDDKIPWYYPLEGDLRKAQTLWDLVTTWRMTKFGKFCTQSFLYYGEKFGVVPKGTHSVGEALIVAADNLVAGGQTKLFTPMQLFIVRKPA
ncbi:putative sterol 24-C-methyltransferase [Atractiella rhizophila]|nr:putative sterol 24-C-methyltransferase [Atractiella rhizophila]